MSSSCGASLYVFCLPHCLLPYTRVSPPTPAPMRAPWAYVHLPHRRPCVHSKGLTHNSTGLCMYILPALHVHSASALQARRACSRLRTCVGSLLLPPTTLPSLRCALHLIAHARGRPSALLGWGGRPSGCALHLTADAKGRPGTGGTWWGLGTPPIQAPQLLCDFPSSHHVSEAVVHTFALRVTACKLPSSLRPQTHVHPTCASSCGTCAHSRSTAFLCITEALLELRLFCTLTLVCACVLQYFEIEA